MNFIFATITFFAICLPNTLFSQNINSKIETETLKKMEYDWLSAEFKLDTAAISRMMDDSFISINESGISNKQEELNGTYKNIEQRLKNGHIVDSLYLDGFSVKFHAETAIVTFISVTKGKIKGTPFTNRRTRFYDVWIKRNGKWKAASSQVTPLH